MRSAPVYHSVRAATACGLRSFARSRAGFVRLMATRSRPAPAPLPHAVVALTEKTEGVSRPRSTKEGQYMQCAVASQVPKPASDRASLEPSQIISTGSSLSGLPGYHSHFPAPQPPKRGAPLRSAPVGDRPPCL
jgi:hypothetical protein